MDPTGARQPADERARRAGGLVAAALDARAFPAAVVEVGSRADVIWTEAFGRLTFERDAPACRLDTIFDLASLTKVIAPVPLVMRAIEQGGLALDTRVADVVPAWRGADRAAVTVRHLLDHSAGLPAHQRLWQRLERRDQVEAAVATLPLERPPGTAAVYSDPGFILLTFVLERALGARLDALFRPLSATLGPVLTFTPAPALRDDIAPTEDDPWRGRVLRGEVHDENAALCEGVAGHAGLFGTAGAVGRFARLALETFTRPTALGAPELMRTFAARSTVPGSSRALGWDTMLPTSSCGGKLSAQAIGHTGFTGTSLWIDPARDFYVVLLTNRVHPTRENVQLQALRPRLHDALVEGFGA